jgi:rhomboid family GlyGly-CTERM serine protease
LLSFIPGFAEALEYDRGAVESGELWRLLTGQLVHWTARMTIADLGVILLLGIWLERRSRKLFISSQLIAAGLIAAGLLLSRGMEIYRGSSGLAAAAFTMVALLLLFDSRLHMAWRGVALLAIILLVSKMIWEMRTGTALVAGHLPHGVQVTPLVHLLGAIAGAVTFAGCRRLLNVTERPE